MKRIIAAAMATLTLCSCSLSDGETEMSSEIPEETTTFVFTGVPEMPALDFSGGASHTTAAENTAPEETSAADEENSSGEETPAEGTAAGELFCLDVPYYSQDEYPTGCELVCASMLLA